VKFDSDCDSGGGAGQENGARSERTPYTYTAQHRFTREGALATLQHLALFGSYGVRFRSYTEPYLDSCGLWGGTQS
jgi:hypothetical protein